MIWAWDINSAQLASEDFFLSEEIILSRTTTLGKASVITYAYSWPESAALGQVDRTLTSLCILQQLLGTPRWKHVWSLPPTRKS